MKRKSKKKKNARGNAANPDQSIVPSAQLKEEAKRKRKKKEEIFADAKNQNPARKIE